MKLYILRHGRAVERKAPGFTENSRPLTDEGVTKMKKAANGMKAVISSFDVILTSPLKRAFDTATIVADAFNYKDKPEVCEALSPGSDPKELLDYVKRHFQGKRVLLVGHEPHLGHFAAAALEAPVLFDFKKGGLCLLEKRPDVPGKMLLVMMLPPKVLRAMRRSGRV